MRALLGAEFNQPQSRDMGRELSWESVAFAMRRSGVRSSSAPPFRFPKTSEEVQKINKIRRFPFFTVQSCLAISIVIRGKWGQNWVQPVYPSGELPPCRYLISPSAPPSQVGNRLSCLMSGDYTWRFLLAVASGGD